MGTQLLCDVLRRDRRFELLPEARDLDALVALHANVALLAFSVEYETFKGVALITELRRRDPNLRLIILVEESSREAVTDSLRAGARGVFCRSEPLNRLSKCIVSVHNGQVWISQKELEYLLQALADPIPIRLVDAKGATLLSAREQTVVRCVAEGLTNREIADKLELSEHTIKNYLFRIFEKLGISNRMELILYVVSQLNLVPEQPDPARLLDPQDAGAASLYAFELAQRYREGKGVEPDLVSAYVWFELAEDTARQCSAEATAALAELRATLQPEQVAEAQRRLAEWRSQLQVSAVRRVHAQRTQGLPASPNKTAA